MGAPVVYKRDATAKGGVWIVNNDIASGANPIVDVRVNRDDIAGDTTKRIVVVGGYLSVQVACTLVLTSGTVVNALGLCIFTFTPGAMLDLGLLVARRYIPPTRKGENLNITLLAGATSNVLAGEIHYKVESNVDPLIADSVWS